MEGAAGSSPLSSPPASVVQVALGSPIGKEDQSPVPSDHQEATAGSLDVSPKESSATGHKEKAQGKASAKAKEKKRATQDSDEGTQSSTQKRKASVSRKTAPVKKARHTASEARKTSAQDKKWEAPFVFTDPRSPLAYADLRVRAPSLSLKDLNVLTSPSKAILLHPDAWDVLTPEEKKEVLAKCPDGTPILDAGTEAARPDLASLANDDNFRYDCVRYCENIELGRHDEEWLRQAWVAHEKHKRGDYDDFLREQFEEDWGIQMPVESKAQESEPPDAYKDVTTDAACPTPPDAPEASEEKGSSPRPSKPPDRSPSTQQSSDTRNDHANSRAVPQGQEVAASTLAAQSD
ncbi:hypothetical protein MYCTH_2301285 [Thermothelomyces thermophilus ATCC 42464]|uniref:ASX DEUBAD domain-containing protein n=1 Tax=Thermothelomyces thermophilus (strain ATCC 42464 / BCRC 31852 / DSM 1799) TaxID=573729 RepID=G2Q9E3_THET4|nr:uncharacterized protein MYCTH_2301285 [Thermothelomyces thermophilus ATCC 42464]AEO56402.1 hypothetical protein MYCTH_2301285 [Thermothelomyces thermophilus ATCC 42464]